MALKNLFFLNNSGINRNTNLIRDALSHCFMSDEGKLPWQFEKI